MQTNNYRYQERTENKTNIIKVTGEGRVSVQPDRVELSLGVLTEDPSLIEAQRNNAMAIAKVKQALNQIGITSEKMKTIDYSIYPQYDYEEGKQTFKNYKIEHLLQITVDIIENTGLVVDTAVSNGVNNVLGITFTSSNYEQFYRQALSLAVIQAGKKAEIIANTLRVTLNPTPISVIENLQQNDGPMPLKSTAFIHSAPTTPILPSALNIHSNVTTKFVYF